MNRQIRRERRAFLAQQEELDRLIEEKAEPIPPDTEIIDERQDTENRASRFRRSRRMGVGASMNKNSYLSGGSGDYGAAFIPRMTGNQNKLARARGERGHVINWSK